jgi:hypothetical protein
MYYWQVLNQVLLTAMLDEVEKIAVARGRMTVPQTRSGRRSMSVDTMLRKDKDGTLFKNQKASTLTEET